jgi:molecular chaperone GrpE
MMNENSKEQGKEPEKHEDEKAERHEEKQSGHKAEKEHAKEMHKKFEALQKEKDETFARLQRVSADFINFQKRVPKQIADSLAYEKEKLIKSFLPILDNFEHVIQNAKKAQSVDAMVKGVEIIRDQMLDILKSHGVEQIQAVGEKFDPAFHHALMFRAEHDKEENIILEEYEKGYKLDGRVIRPIKVVVNKLPPPVKEEAKAEETKPQQEESAEKKAELE